MFQRSKVLIDVLYSDLENEKKNSRIIFNIISLTNISTNNLGLLREIE